MMYDNTWRRIHEQYQEKEDYLFHINSKLNKTKRRIIIITILDDDYDNDVGEEDDVEDDDWGLMIEDWELRMRMRIRTKGGWNTE